MPLYEYRCEDCEATFTQFASIAEKAKGLPVVCRICGSERVKQVFTGISLIGGNRGGTTGSGGGCRPGGGCCR